MKETKMYKRWISYLMGLSLLLTIQLDAAARQGSIVVKGVVFEKQGGEVPLAGASVVVKGSGDGTITNAQGRFQLTVADESVTLVFSYIGMIPQEIVVGKQRNVNVYLESGDETLDEVVVTGYGTQRKSDLTGAVAVVSSKELLKVPANNALQGLKGKVSGVMCF